MLVRELLKESDPPEQPLSAKKSIAKANIGKLMHMWSAWSSFEINKPSFKGSSFEVNSLRYFLYEMDFDFYVTKINAESLDIKFYKTEWISPHNGKLLLPKVRCDSGTINFEQIWSLSPSFKDTDSTIKMLLTRYKEGSLKNYKQLISAAKKEGLDASQLDQLKVALEKSLKAGKK